MKKTNRAAQDTTLINLRALKKRVTALEVAVKALQERKGSLYANPESSLRKALKRLRKGDTLYVRAGRYPAKAAR